MRIDQLTFTRFIAAVSIVIFHFGYNVFPFNTNLLAYLFKQANIGVSYFFILSGFVMVIAYGNKKDIDYLSYFKSRFARIYPVYFLAILLFVVYSIIIKAKINQVDLLLNILAIQAWVPGKALSFNYPGWSLSVEIFFYLLFPFLLKFIYNQKKIKPIIISVMLVWVCTQVIFNAARLSSFYQGMPSKSYDLLFYFPVMHVSEFLMGNVAGLLYIKKLQDKKRNYDWAIILLIIILILVLRINTVISFHDGLLAFLFIPLILLIALNTGWLTRICKRRGLVFLGEISYGLYILQMPVFIYMASIFKYVKFKNEHLQFYLSLFVLIVASAISYNIIETPVRKWVKNRSFRQQYPIKEGNDRMSQAN